MTRETNIQRVCCAKIAAKYTAQVCSLIFQLQYFLVLLFTDSSGGRPIEGKDSRKYLHHRLPDIYIKVQLSSKAVLALEMVVGMETGRVSEIPLK